jgi:hypothetical protein
MDTHQRGVLPRSAEDTFGAGILGEVEVGSRAPESGKAAFDVATLSIVVNAGDVFNTHDLVPVDIDRIHEPLDSHPARGHARDEAAHIVGPPGVFALEPDRNLSFKRIMQQAGYRPTRLCHDAIIADGDPVEGIATVRGEMPLPLQYVQPGELRRFEFVRLPADEAAKKWIELGLPDGDF